MTRRTTAMKVGNGLFLLAGLSALLAACGGNGGGQEGTTLTPGAIRVPGRVLLDSLALSVPLDFDSIEGGECEAAPGISDSSGALRIAMIWGPEENPSRQVTVSFGGMGNPVRFSDLRGAMTRAASKGKGIPGTAIYLDLPRRQAIVTDQDETGASRTVMLPFQEALESQTLGMPGKMMERVLEACGRAGILALPN